MKILKTQRSIALLLLIVGLAAGVALSQGMKAVKASGAVAPDATPLSIPDPVQLSNAFSKLAKEVEPSVVQVTSTIEQKMVQRRSPHGGQQPGQQGGQPDADDFFRRFFGGDPFGGDNQGQGAQPQRPFKSQGTGSGFVVDSHGYILTNNHVVEGATKVQVQLHGDQTQYTAKVIGTDPELDLAVIKIDAGHPLDPVKIGNSDGIEVGDWAVAIGSPFGLDETVTAGIISAKGRDLGSQGHQLQRFLQTDAAINPGNSGGPLLDIKGQVVGVNTMIATNSGASDGVGFALPINMAVSAYNQIIKTGKVSRGAIGILFQRQQNPELLKAYGTSSGVFVSQVTAGTPAFKAGLKEGDIVKSFNGKPVANGDELVGLVSETPVGAKVPITVLRGDKTVDLTIEVADRANIIAGNTGDAAPGPDSAEGGDQSQSVKFGISVRALRQEDRDTMSFTATGGVLVTDVESNSFGEDIGLQHGDMLMAIDRQAISSPADVKKIAGTLKPGQAVAFKVLRSAGQLAGGGATWTPVFLAGTLPASQ
ncbi:MAG TPA: Do family serine endopeptidase [Bryobacteraceae bacterium]|nr:Do family serine endopeptidase [Bryobacteraceae bacterium]